MNRKKQAVKEAPQPVDLPEVLVRLHSPAMANLYAGIKGRALKIAYPSGWAVIEAGSVENARRLAADWQSDSLVSFAGVNQKVSGRKFAFTPNDPYYPFNSPAGHLGQWHLRNTANVGGANIDVRVNTPWSNDWTGSGVIVGIVDDSVQIGHPDLSPNHSAPDSWDFGQSDADPSPVHSDDDHGTAVSGVAVARGGNGVGVTGAAPHASLAGLRLDFQALTVGMIAAADEHRSSGATTTIKLKNHSYGIGGPYVTVAAEAAALANSASAGTIHVYAAGNSRGASDEDTGKWHAQSNPNVINVAALAARGTFSDYSSFGACVFVTSPSNGYIDFVPSGYAGISTTDRTGASGYNSPFDNNYTNSFGGTSSASPLAAGVLALLKHRIPGLNVRYAKHMLARHSERVDLADATPTSDGGWRQNAAGLWFNQNYGFGLINAQNLISNAGSYGGVSALTQTNIGTTNVAQAIPDSTSSGTLGTAVTRTFNIASTTPLEEVLVTLNITHTWRGDVEARLTSPSGTTSRLMYRAGTDGTDNINWTFSTNAFWGENPAGTWTLAVQDAFVNDTGTWNSYSVNMRQGTLLPSFTLALAPTSVVGGGTSTGTVTLPAPAGSNTTVNLSYSGTGVSGPATATITAGNSSVNFTVNTATVDANVAGVVTATIGGSSVPANLTVLRAGVADITVSPSPVGNGINATGTVTLNGPVTANRTVSLTYAPLGNYAVSPATVTVLAGQSTANFTFRSNLVPAGFAGSITASLNSISDVANFNVTAVNLQGTQIYPINAYAGQKLFGVVRLAAPRASAVTVSVTSSHPSLIPNQSVNIPAGQTFGVFTATAGNPSSGQQWVTLTSTDGIESRQESSLVRPASNLLASGMNNSYEVGDGLTRHREFMSVVRGGDQVLQSAYSKDTLVVLKSGGTVWTVGKGEFGQHGDGTSGPAATKTVLTQVPGLSNIIQIASVSELAVLALSSTGQVYAWGQNPHGQAGKTPFGIVSTPYLIPGLSNVVAVGSAATASFALDSNGDIWSWGSNSNGAGGRGAAGNTAVPTKLTTVAGPFVELGLGRNFGFAIHANGNLYGWGVNTSGQLGLGDFVNRTTMVQVPVSDVRQAGGGLSYGILLRTPPHGTIPVGGNRQVLTSGGNNEGQRGQGAVGGGNTNTFALIANNNGNINQIGAGNRHAFYVSQGVVRSWGVGSLGERADGTFVAASGTPTQIPSTPTVSGVLVSTNNSTLITQVPSNGRAEMILTDGTNLKTANFRTNVITNLTGTVPAGHTVVGGGEVAGNSTRNEVITVNGAGLLHYMEANGNVLGASTSLGVTLGATEFLSAVANMDNAGRMDFVTFNWATGAVVARLYNGTVQTGTRNLYTLAANESVAGVGDFDVDRFQDLLIFNSATRTFTVRRYNASGTFLGTASLVNAPNTPAVPTPLPAVPAGIAPWAAAETMTGYGSNLVFLNTATNNFETWQFSRLNMVATGIVGPALPGGHYSGGFWR